MRVGIAGFAGVGKSTLFELLTGVKPSPTAGLKGQLGIARVPDPRMGFLGRLLDSKKVTPVTMDLVDLPALVGDDPRESARRLALVREAHGIVVVLGAFAGADPVAELARFREELVFADLLVASTRSERVREAVKKNRPERPALEQELAMLERVREVLEAGRRAGTWAHTPDEQKRVAAFQFLTDKPIMPIVNLAEDRHAEPPPESLGPTAVGLCARMELELAELDHDERAPFMEEMGLSELARDRVLRAVFAAMGGISFFTGAHRTELRAWAIPRGSDAVAAAGAIHTDIADGFIRAEVIGTDHLESAGDLKGARAKGWLRTEGRAYIVQDGDVVLFRHS